MPLSTKKIGFILFTFLYTLFLAFFYVLPIIHPDFLTYTSRFIAILNHRFLFFLGAAFLLLYIDHFTTHMRRTWMRWMTNIAALLWFVSFAMAYLSQPMLFLIKNL